MTHISAKAVFGVLLLLTASAFAKDKITLVVRNTQTDYQQRTYFIPGTDASATTTCNGTTVGSDGVATTNTNCKTTFTPATDPTTRDVYIRQELVSVVMSNGTYLYLTCHQGWRLCPALEAGSYTAEVHGDHNSVFTLDGNGKNTRLCIALPVGEQHCG